LGLGCLSSEELGFFVSGLESSVTELTGGIDELKGDFFEGDSLGLGEKTLSEDDHSSLGADNTALNHDEIVSDDTVVGESSHGGDVLIGEISSGGSVILGSGSFSLSDSVDLLVHFGSVMVTILSGSSDGPSNTGRMPGSNATNSSVTSMGLLLQVLNTVSLDDSGGSVTSGDTDNVDHFVLVEDGISSDFLFEKAVGEVDFLGGVSSVNLDFDDVVLLLSEVEELHLGGGNNSDD